MMAKDRVEFALGPSGTTKIYKKAPAFPERATKPFIDDPGEEIPFQTSNNLR